MDTSDPYIEFDELGVCNHCRRYETISAPLQMPEAEREKHADAIIQLIKESGKNNEYDCIIGISGGMDSSYLACILKKHGCRPLAVHLDNGWNSELAVKNIENLVRKTGIDLFTHVIDWDEYRDLQLAFLKASVLNIEAPTDHAFRAILYRTAIQKQIKYFVTGLNIATESLCLSSWGYFARDFRQIKSIQKRYGKIPLKTFPHLSFLEDFYFTAIRGVRELHLLDHIPYNKANVVRYLEEELGWKNYGGKHYESVFTRFFQGYIFPTKFKIDKRRAHLSNLVQSGQITRQEALKKIEEPIYPEGLLAQDREFFLKKFGLTESEFQKIMDAKPVSHKEFATNEHLYKLWKILALLKRKIISSSSSR